MYSEVVFDYIPLWASSMCCSIHIRHVQPVCMYAHGAGGKPTESKRFPLILSCILSTLEYINIIYSLKNFTVWNVKSLANMWNTFCFCRSILLLWPPPLLLHMFTVCIIDIRCKIHICIPQRPLITISRLILFSLQPSCFCIFFANL